jgi:type I restriction enzyme S subunit
MTYGRFRPDENKVLANGSEFAVELEIRPGDLLLSRANTRDYVGASVLVPEDCRPRLLLSDKSLRLRPGPGVDRKWLWYALTNPVARRYLGEMSSGVKQGMRNISQTALKSLPLLVPPICEQRRIVELLDDNLSRLDAGETLLACAALRVRAMEASSLSSAASGPESSLGEVAEIQGGIQKQPKRQPRENAYPFLRVANVTAHGLDLSEVHTIELFGAELERLRLHKGDLLVVEGNGSPSQIGRASVWDGSIQDCVHQNHLIRVRPGPGLLPAYLEAVWNSPKFRRNLTDVASSTSGLYTLSVAKLAKLRLAVPSPDEQQNQIRQVANVRRHARRLRDDATSSARKAQQLRRALLGAAFSGRLTAADST